MLSICKNTTDIETQWSNGYWRVDMNSQVLLILSDECRDESKSMNDEFVLI